MRKILLIGLLFLTGCSLNTQVTTASVSCGQDMQCAEKLLESCKPGTYIEDESTSTRLEYTVEGVKNNTCLITWKFHQLEEGNLLENLSMTCALPLSITTTEALREHLSTTAMQNRLSDCSGPLKDKLLSPVQPLLDEAADTAKGRDAKRVSDLKRLQTALEIFYSEQNRYPAGDKIIVGSKDAACLNNQGWQAANCKNAYLDSIPSDPSPSNYYSYSLDSNGQNYKVTAKLEGESQELKGVITLTNVGIH